MSYNQKIKKIWPEWAVHSIVFNGKEKYLIEKTVQRKYCTALEILSRIQKRATLDNQCGRSHIRNDEENERLDRPTHRNE